MTLVSWRDPGAQVTAQPVTIGFRRGGRSRRYTPDFLVAWSGGTSDLVEIKYRHDLRADWPRLRPAFAAARSWAGAHAMRFRIATERGIRGPRLDAAKRLLPLRTAPIDTVLAEAAVARASIGPMAFGDLVDALPAARAAALAVVWRLVARGALVIDVSTPIVPTTLVRRP
ncbi:MAG: Tn7 transposase TnsA N-terminal domain-containing protein [Acetobacteraceae bacterium]